MSHTMFQASYNILRSWQVIVAAALLTSQALLIAHNHDQETGQAQVAGCVTCVAAQNASPACPNALPEVEQEIGHSPFLAEIASALDSAQTPTARQRSPPVPG
ncbi:MAG: hypothetical protein RLN69_05895 [Woeseiaceae bacterium]